MATAVASTTKKVVKTPRVAKTNGKAESNVVPINAAKRPRTRVEVVTPEIAARWLEANETNRKIRSGKVEEYAADMLAGKWYLTGENIIFGASGRLLNGQHRLWAIIMAGVAVEMNVTRGVENEEDVMDVLDSGIKRTISDAFGVRGGKDTNVLASIVSGCWRFERAGGVNSSHGTPSHVVAREWLMDHEDVLEALPVAREAYRQLRVPTTAVGVAYFLNAQVDPAAATEFWRLATSGENLPAKSPILAFRRWVIATLSKRDKPRHNVWLTMCLKAMKLWREGKQTTLLTYRENEEVTPWKK